MNEILLAISVDVGCLELLGLNRHSEACKTERVSCAEGYTCQEEDAELHPRAVLVPLHDDVEVCTKIDEKFERALLGDETRQ